MWLDPELPEQVLAVRNTLWDRFSVGYPGAAFDRKASECTLKPLVEYIHPKVKVTKKIHNIQQFLKELQ